jgi:Flp pilus assembly protein TadD
MNAQSTTVRPTAAAAASQPSTHAARPRTLPAGDIEATYALACEVYRQGHYTRAISLFAYLTMRRPTHRRYLHGLGTSQFMAGQYERAVQTLAFLLLNHPLDHAALCLYGHALLLTGERDEAFIALTLSLQQGSRTSCYAQRARQLLELIEA